MNRISRRSALAGAAGLGLATSLGSIHEASASQATELPNFSDPVIALRTHVKLVGSLAKETIYSFMRLNIYADTGEGNFVPLFTLNNILVDHWTPKGNDQYEMRKYEVDFYSRHGSHEILEHFDNPITGKREARLSVIEGQPPIMAQAPKACPFGARCAHHFARCDAENPQRRPLDSLPLGQGHDVACHWSAGVSDA